MWRPEDRQLAVSSLLPPHGFQGLKSDHQACQQTLLPAEPSLPAQENVIFYC